MSQRITQQYWYKVLGTRLVISFPYRVWGLQIRRALCFLRTAQHATWFILLQWRWNGCYLLVNSDAVINMCRHALCIGLEISSFFSHSPQKLTLATFFFHCSCYLLLFKAHLQTADRRCCSGAAVKVTKPSGRPTTLSRHIDGVPKEHPARISSAFVIHAKDWPCRKKWREGT